MVPFDFTVSGSLAAAFGAAAALPLCLAVIARVPFAASRNALQFLITVIVVVAAWMSALLFVPAAQPNSVSETIVSALVVGIALLFYLEIWALLSRGYTLGLLITLYRSGRPLSAAELARTYRGGEGLEWIMQHRLAGVESAGLVYRNADSIVLTRWRGRAVAWTCRVAVALLGLEATG
jgi:hypothetical protein